VTSHASEVDAAFAPPAENWIRVSPKLATARRLTLSLFYLFVVGFLIIMWVLPTMPNIIAAVAAIAAAVLFIWAWWLIGRRVRAYGYAERDEDLLVVSGILIKRLVIVPYGRMQMVDLTAGPIDRWLGIATVQLHTAAATTDATIPGLPPEEAAILRDRLAARGEERSAGM